MNSHLNLSEELEQCRRSFGARPRHFSFWGHLSYLNTAKPIWLTSRDGLSQFFSGKRDLLKNGVIVWGHVVQANQLMFRAGIANCPGEVVYGTDQGADLGPQFLEPIAKSLYQLKGQQTGRPELQYIADYLAHERIRVFGLPVPESISGASHCAISTVFYDRKHLPTGTLRIPFFPLIVNSKEPRIAMVLPSKYWSPKLIALWKSI